MINHGRRRQPVACRAKYGALEYTRKKVLGTRQELSKEP